MLVTRRQKRGAEVSAANLSKGLHERGHRIIWAGLYPPKNDVLELDGIMNIDLKGGTSFFSIAKWRHLRKIIKEYKVTIIQANGSDTLKYALAARWGFTSCKVIYRNISLVSYWIGASTLRKLFYRWLSQKADYVVSVGKPSREDFIKTYQYPENKISVIHRGIPVHPLDKKTCRDKIIVEFNLPQDAKILVWAGALSIEKDPLFALEVFCRVQKRMNPVFLIYAGKGNLDKELLQEKARLGLDHIILTGYREDLPALLAGSDLLILTSRIEGVPGVVLEAGVQQTVSVAINVGGVGEAIEDGKTGVLISERDADLFANQVIDLLNNSSLLSQYAEAAFQNVKNHFHEAVTTGAFVELYRRLSLTNKL
jgi:glycosyltransferase involved in cell wall biosynthesis